ncbi:hypothetical protein [Streptomyces sp. NPDC058612]|uniref:hypothetical protein n=1 Tax=Streptomyces sp. NPDC058612 TaxID=3346555 RepID=UPI003661ACC7
MTAPKADPLYVRYMEAFSASTLHTRDCASCQHCGVGAPIYKAFAKAQDAYQDRQSVKRRS